MTHPRTQIRQAFVDTPRSANIGVFASVDAQQVANTRLAFYSIGESLDLTLLDARVTTLINAFAAAIA